MNDSVLMNNIGTKVIAISWCVELGFLYKSLECVVHRIHADITQDMVIRSINDV